MTRKLKALIHGSGYAGQGHALALRDAGVEVTGMVSRTESVVRSVAGRMGIAYASTDWNRALADLEPDIAVIGTPGGAHVDSILSAMACGCHVFCDKPLATTAEQAEKLYRMSIRQKVKTAFAASYRYQPHALLARQLVATNAIGVVQETECISHYNLDPLIPWGWSHRIALGGGRLSNNFTHKLSIVEHVLDGRIRKVCGETRNDMRKAPVVTGVHDFRERSDFAPTRAAVRQNPGRWEWREVDSEWSYTVMGQLVPKARAAGQDPVSLLFKHSGLQPDRQGDYVAFYGSEGVIFIEGAYAQGPLFLWTRDNGQWQEVPLPEHIRKTLPAIEDNTQRNWTCLARSFVADLLGQGYDGYQTFRDGWLYQEVVDAVRRADGWYDLPADPGASASACAGSDDENQPSR